MTSDIPVAGRAARSPGAGRGVEMRLFDDLGFQAASPLDGAGRKLDADLRRFAPVVFPVVGAGAIC